MNTITWNWLWFALVFVAGGYLLSRLRDPTGGGSSLTKGVAPPPPRGNGGRRSAPPVAPRHRSPAPVIDPVTRESVCTATAPAFFYQGRVYFFASVRSRERFEASPRAYLRSHKPGPENPDPTFDGAGCVQSARARGVATDEMPTRGGGIARPDSPEFRNRTQQGARDGR